MEKFVSKTLKYVAILAVVVLTFAVGAERERAQAAPSDPEALPQTGIAWLDNIYYGTAPPDSAQQPVLLFVHGLGGLASDWWTETQYHGPQDMYLLAYQAKYRTAFVTLNENGERSPIESIWVNGNTLAKQITAIANHYGVEQVDIVAHSKGGVDAQTALVYFGAAPRVRNMFTLSAPHWGTEIADLAFENPIGAIIAALMGLRGPGTFTVTTTYMELYRAVTDARTEDDNVNYYWAAGTDCCPRGTGLRFIGQWLEDRFGPNDGLITVANAQLPGDNSTMLFIEDLNHDNIVLGSEVFSYIDEVARVP